MKIYLLIAKRFLFPKNDFRSNTINFISFIGLFIGAASIVLSISVLNGFQGILQNETKKLYGDFLVENLNKLNYKLIKLLEIHKENKKHGDFNITITKMRPPIFWKDKPIYLKLLKKWHISGVQEALSYLAKIEEKLKKNSTLNGITVIKNAITNICTNSWTYF